MLFARSPQGKCAGLLLIPDASKRRLFFLRRYTAARSIVPAVQLAFIIADRSNTLKRCAPFKSLQTIPYNVGRNFDVSTILEVSKRLLKFRLVERRESFDSAKLDAQRLTAVPRGISARVLIGSAKPVVNAQMRGLTHVVFSLQRGREGAVGEHGIQSRVKVDLTFPCP